MNCMIVWDAVSCGVFGAHGFGLAFIASGYPGRLRETSTPGKIQGSKEYIELAMIEFEGAIPNSSFSNSTTPWMPP